MIKKSFPKSIFLRFTLEIEQITPISKKYIESHILKEKFQKVILTPPTIKLVKHENFK